MKKIELLAPAGTMEALYAAVQNGCDAVYLGGSAFGARAFAGNFNNDEIIEAIEYAHIYGVKVYVTMNTLLYEDEIDQAMEYAYFLYQHDVDALIIQDLGFFHRLHLQLPDLELHASTQMHIHNQDGIELIKELGGKRVVLPRETTIEEICSLTKHDIDIEVFVHGALCVGYSGQCLMSSLLYGRSGNRGECAQPCRMKYKLWMKENKDLSQVSAKGEYLLSPKDLNTIEHIGQLIDVGVTSFKIEGRMKRPEYVAQVVSLYRKAIDAHIHKQKFVLTKTQHDDLKKIFNRGFTSGHIFHNEGKALMNPIRPNHIGIEIGTVIQATKNRVTVRLHDTLFQGDGIRILDEKEDQGWRVHKIYNQKGLLIKEGHAKDIVSLEYRGYVEKGSKLLKTSDVQQLKQLQLSYENPNRKISVDIQFTMQIGKPAHILVKDKDGYVIEVQSNQNVEEALTAPMSLERIEKQIRKCKDTPFQIEGLDFNVDKNGFINIKEINRMRREALQCLMEKRKKRYDRHEILPYEFTITVLKPSKKNMIIMNTLEQYYPSKEVSHELYTQNTALYKQLTENGESIGLHEGRVVKSRNKNMVMSGEQGGIIRGCRIADSSFNVTNSYTAACLFQSGIEIVTFSLEHSVKSIKRLTDAFYDRYHMYGNFAVEIYGYKELMMSEYCVVNACFSGHKKNCTMCRGKRKFYLQDLKGKYYPLLNDLECRMHILQDKATDKSSELETYKQMHITNFIYRFTIETEEETKQLLEKIRIKK